MGKIICIFSYFAVRGNGAGAGALFAVLLELVGWESGGTPYFIIFAMLKGAL